MDTWEEFWSELEHELAGARNMFSLPVQTREEAVRGVHKRAPDDPDGFALKIIARRDVSHEFDNLDAYLDEGRKLLPRFEELYDSRALTPEMMALWTRIQFCHGFIVAHSMDNSNSWPLHYAGSKTILDEHKKWLAQFLAAHIDEPGTLKASFNLAFEEIELKLRDASISEEQRMFFRRMFNKAGDALTRDLSPKYFSEARIRELSRTADPEA